MQIDFNRTLKDNCPAFTIVPDAPPPDFKPHYLYGTDDQTVFTVDIGQAGSEQGYKALTGNQFSLSCSHKYMGFLETIVLKVILY